MKKIFSVVMVVFLIFGWSASSFAKDFSDVPPNHQYYDDIQWAVSKGLISGYKDGTFKPDHAISRVEYAVILHRLLAKDWWGKKQSKVSESYNPPFIGLDEKDWYYIPACFQVAICDGQGELYNSKSGRVFYEPNTYLERWKFASDLGKLLRLIGWDRWKPDEPIGYKWDYVSPFPDFRIKENGFEINYIFSNLDLGRVRKHDGLIYSYASKDHNFDYFFIYAGIASMVECGALVTDGSPFEPNKLVSRGELLHWLRKVESIMDRTDSKAYLRQMLQ